MATYLLLRDNKESGPFSLNDLLSVGLKAYDLVWVPGKSAAWRYPSEIEELKPYAPGIEEQPFDRFYKKTAEDKKQDPEVIEQQSEYAPRLKQKEELFVPRKSVFVTLPGSKTVAVERPVKSQPVTKESPVSPAITITESPEPIETKYSQPLDEIKEMYVKSLQQRKNRTARKTHLMTAIKKGSVIAALILVGLMAGFFIKSKPSKSNPITQATIPASAGLISDVANEKAESTVPDDNRIVAGQDEGTRQDAKLVPSSTIDPLGKKAGETQPPTITIRKETMIKPIEKKEFDNNQAAPNADFDVVTGERTRKVRTGGTNPEEGTVEKKTANSLNDLVSVSSNDYKRVAFGGIRNLQLTVTNNSKYELDNVIVELQYLKPSEEPLRTENIRFRAVAPNESSTIKIPDTNRGIKISYKIINIESKQNRDDVAGR